MLNVVWFKRDLRIEDHAPLAEAARHGTVLPLYISEPGYWALPDTSARQWDFTAECLVELRERLRALGQPLIVRQGDAVALLRKLHARHGIAGLWSHEETGNLWTFERDKAVLHFCREAGIPWQEFRQFGVIRRLKSRNDWAGAHRAIIEAPLVSTPARLLGIPDISEGAIPGAQDLGLVHDPCPGRQRGSRREALALLEGFLAGRGRNYARAMSSPLSAQTHCSRLSPYLALGTLSMREAFQITRAARENLAALPPSARPVQLGAIDSFIARLFWHCHFIQKLESEPAIEHRATHPLMERHRLFTAQDDPVLAAWIEGRTGFPFVDACMRSLNATGWINFRMRAMLMAFASYHLALDWRVSGAQLARLFTDYEPGIHWPQVQMQSGQTGINIPRIYNPLKQSLDQDAEGVFIRKWVPELAALPNALLHAPWRMNHDEAARYGVVLGRDYPVRLVDHELAARAARERLSDARREAGFRELARAVHEKHGSRKGAATRRRAPLRDRSTAGQGDLFAPSERDDSALVR